MTIYELIKHLLPEGTDAFDSMQEEHVELPAIDWKKCPTWPIDLFALVGSIIERSGCYTLASPNRKQLEEHKAYLAEIALEAQRWNANSSEVPESVNNLWWILTLIYPDVHMHEIASEPDLVKALLSLFAIADEACIGMGWDVDPANAPQHQFSSITFAALTKADQALALPHLPHSLCVIVSPDSAVVLPKSINSAVGCTIRSLSHYLALLAPSSVLNSSWILSSKKPPATAAADPTAPYDMRLLLIPFPFTIHADSFKLSSPRMTLGANHIPAYFELVASWLNRNGKQLTGELLARELIIPLIQQAIAETGAAPNGIILPECALTTALAGELVDALKDSGIDFLITGVLDTVEDGTHYNRALTFAFQEGEEATIAEQNKHHRWRLDRGQTERYALHFDPDPNNDKWWEDIDVSQRKLPFLALHKDMSLATLICEDLARTDPAMTAIRAVGPNLVVALLMDGPQLAVRWPGRYATVLAEDPGSAVLSFTCAAMVDRSNWLQAIPARAVGLWRDGAGRTQEIGLAPGSLGVLLTLQSKKKHQNTLDNRSDNSLSRQLTLRTVVPLFLADVPNWL
ncbi:hypothetical protein [Janthinobacterium sp. Ant5-2-1]|uniref:hypothetical protein n=1 Tax=Janthinobacterium sp. Ant5-2-1 TaxID=1755239 RepID=UPI000717E3FA|nr:hypothetical protein [Janthinobacterium sp. Ant5-2-1]